VLALCFHELDLQRIQGLPITENTAARRAGGKCGMIHDGALSSFAFQKGCWWNFEVYAILAPEFHGSARLMLTSNSGWRRIFPTRKISSLP
jgi:RimJ/RimL family protein N-acetyltransferase